MTKRTKQSARKHPKKHPVRQSEGMEASPAVFARDVGKSLLITVGAALLLLLAASLAAYFSPNPTSLCQPLGLTVAALTALIGGISMIRVHGTGSLLCGFAIGTVLMGAVILASLFFRADASGYPAWASLALHAAFLALSVAGAYMGRRRTPKRRKR